MSTAIIGHIFQVVQDAQGTLSIDSRPDHGLMIDDQGTITSVMPKKDCGHADRIVDYGDRLILPGFIDTHVHFPQTDMIGVYSGELLEWLDEHTFPHETALIQDPEQAKDSAKAFANELFRHGTCTAVAFACSKKSATQILFEEFDRNGARLVSGKISMNRFAPEGMLDQIDDDLQAQSQLIQDWNGKDERLFYALSPRFAPSCSADLLQGISDLLVKNPKLYVQTHFAENLDEVAWVKDLFPKSTDYLGVYEDYGLINERCILAHGIYASASERERLKRSRTMVSHCPTSNLFLGSGLLPYRSFREQGIVLGLGTDVGAGTSFSLWQTMAEAVKVSKLRREQVLPEDLFFAATLGAAQGLQLSDRIGSLEAGKQADFQVIDPSRRELLKRRLPYCHDHRQFLSALIFHCDDRNLESLWVKGRKIFENNTSA
ncbi:guanine deaminase [Pseudobacteriovorax antillogorgiicola]|uniref:Guanine deaminase n=2 Tax=Pseudobacteriovorax antillogorgiicola TaxID=1513793 RepID=A0A1Y6CHS2_9BACT|nr:guanine deaminase [Pseudobacteriovorax antillogorgiicola]SMF55667.1 guanine deaminase [Pseudobacteriovorax antillogorgiicola]